MTAKLTRTDSSIGTTPRDRPSTPNVPIHTGDHDFEAWEEGLRFGGRELFVSRMAGASQVHLNVMVVPAGKQSCPFHFHTLEEEHFYVLNGRCVLRSGKERFAVVAGDYVCFPAGQEVGHSFENPFEGDCRILAIGPANPAEIAVYPDSGKAKLRATQTIIEWPQDSMDYWAGERTSDPIGSRNGSEEAS